MAEQGVIVDLSTIARWVLRYAPILIWLVLSARRAWWMRDISLPPSGRTLSMANSKSRGDWSVV